MTDLIWKAHYSDGSTLTQRQEYRGRHATYADIDRDRLVAFDLWRNGSLVVRIDLRDDSDQEIGQKRLIWRLRTQLRSDGKQERIHLAGWQRKVKDRNIQAVCYVLEDGAILLGGQWAEKDFIYSIAIHDFEQDLA